MFGFSMARRDTKEALLDAGVDLFLEGGYDFVGTNAILERAKVPRGSFYHHFRDKQDFALATAQHYYERHLPLLDRILTDDEHPPLARLRLYFEALVEAFGRAGWSRGCLLGLLGQELGDRNEEARGAIAKLFKRWRIRLQACLREAQIAGDLSEGADTDALARYLLDGWVGALISMKVDNDGAPLKRFVTVTFDVVLPGYGR